MPRYLFFLACCLATTSLPASVIILSEVMSTEDQKKTGVYNLNAKQKQALQDWLNANFEIKTQTPEKPPEQKLYLSQNIDNGKILRLSDESEYLVAPEDLQYSSYWITPFPLRIENSNNPDYPLMIVNANTGQGVKVRQIKPGRQPTK